MKTPDDVMTLTEHLGELRVRIIRSALAITLGAILISPSTTRCSTSCSAVHRPVHAAGRGVLRLRRRRTATTRCSSSIPLEGLTTRLRDRQLRRAHPRHAGDPVADLALHRPGPARQGEALRDPVHPVARSLLFLLGGFLAYLTLGKALEFLISWSGNDVGRAVPGQQVRPPRRADGRRLRHRLPVPGAARVPAARRRAHAAAADQAAGATRSSASSSSPP